MENKLIKIRNAAKLLNISPDTLRRWDREGKLKSIRLTPSGHRYYDMNEIRLLSSNLFQVAKNWVAGQNPQEPDTVFYCPDSAVFQTRLHTLEQRLRSIPGLEQEFSLLTSVVGEIGNNSFDHNLGSWIDIRGIFFAYDANKRHIALADRGQGILTTLKRVRPDLAGDEQALLVAFTETITGRAPEGRGNGLKYVRKIVTSTDKKMHVELFFQTGRAALDLKNGDTDVAVFTADDSFHGCLAFIKF